MNNDPPTDNDKMKGHTEIDPELIGKLFSAGFTILGLGLPAMAGALVALRDLTISTLMADGLRRLVWLLLPTIVICTIQSLLCLGTLSGFYKKPRLVIMMTVVLILYMMTSFLVWAIFTIRG